ncbi:MAG: hypothetical protein D6698_12675, partial [Gammaproteobacteria bacterium]
SSTGGGWIIDDVIITPIPNDADDIIESSSRKWAAESGADITGAHTAAAIVNQGPGATAPDIDGIPDGATYAKVKVAALTSGQIDLSKSGVINKRADYITYVAGQTIESLKPAEAGSDVTGSHTAAAIVGQGSGATANNLTELNSVEGTKLAGIEDGADVTESRLRFGLLNNGGFETGTTEGWGKSLGDAIEIISGIHYGSSYACRFTVRGSGVGWRLYQWVPVKGGEAVVLTATVKRDESSLPNDDIYFGLSAYDDSGTGATVKENGEAFISKSVSGLQKVRARYVLGDNVSLISARFRTITKGTDGSGHWIVDSVTLSIIPKDAGDVSESTTRKWASESGADITGSHTAAAIVGQGALATKNTVGTADIDDFSVTKADGSFTSASQSFSSLETTIASVTIDTTNAKKVLLNASANLSYSSSEDGYPIIRIKRGSIVLATYVTTRPRNNLDRWVDSFGAIDTSPPGGNQTYSVTVQGSSGNSGTATNRMIWAMVLKK